RTSATSPRASCGSCCTRTPLASTASRRRRSQPLDDRGMPALNRVLIANRGEIAIRVSRAAASLGMESVGVYVPVDEHALHTRLVTNAHPIETSYLDSEGLADLAVKTGCDCVHPGYGFLAESAAFAQACIDRGLIFVGPSP